MIEVLSEYEFFLEKEPLDIVLEISFYTGLGRDNL